MTGLSVEVFISQPLLLLYLASRTTRIQLCKGFSTSEQLVLHH
jgi:hypothetical protein